MKNSEFNKKILEAKDIEWFKNVEETFNFPYINVSIKQEGITAIYKFINQQVEGWNSIDFLPPELENSKRYFSEIKNQIITFVNNYVAHEQNNLSAYWRTVKNLINNTNNFPFLFDSPETKFLINISKTNQIYFSGAFAFFTTNNLSSNNRDSLIGYILGYEYKFKDQSDIFKRAVAEKSSLSNLKSDFKKYLTESEEQLVGHLADANQKYAEYVKQIDDLKTDKEKLVSEWFSQSQTQFETFSSSSSDKMKELEKTYNEHLKYEEPAKYWSLRAEKLKKQGWWALIVMVALVTITAWSLGEILWKAPEQIFSSWFGDDKSAAIRWSIVYITLVSLIAYCIRAVSKVMFSSFHLARDCEERHTLTYFYLALLKDSNVTDADRQLIMQSLFSRAETGLLKDDSTPAMPSDITKLMQR